MGLRWRSFEKVVHWKALYVHSRAEKKVVMALHEKGVEAYLPLKTEVRQWSDRKKKVSVPLINGYVFVRTLSGQRDLVFTVNGVIQYVRYNGADAIIRDEEIEILRAIEAKGYYIEGHFGIKLKEGDSVAIKTGPFKGLEGKIVKSSSEHICYVAIRSIDYQLQIRLPKEVLEKTQ